MNKIHSKYIPSIESLSDQTLHQTLASLESNGISNINWNEYPYAPSVSFRMAHSDIAIAILFEVTEDHVKAVAMEDNGPVWQDSCVEFFVKPASGRGYCNFEFNCGGTMLAFHIPDHRRVPGGFVDFHRLSPEQCQMVNRYTTLPRVNDPERVGKRVWCLAFSIPFEIFAEEFGQAIPKAGDVWSGNFY